MNRRNRRGLLGAGATALALALIGTTTGAGPGTGAAPTRVEEDWELVIGEPSPDEFGPQVTVCMAATSEAGAPYANFNLNYRDYPSFAAGGMQTQVWNGGQRTVNTSAQGDHVFRTAGETVTWTQALSLSNGVMTFRVSNGSSTTWGSFGSLADLAVAYYSSLADLSGYSPEWSIAESGVSWQANRVQSLRLVRVRYYAGSTLLSTDETVRSVALSQ